MISYPEALERIRKRAQCVPLTEVPILKAAGGVAARAVRSGFALPPFDNAAMDGFALRHADCAAASASDPVLLRVQAVVAAGQDAELLQPGQAIKIMTGAPLPHGADVVVPIEDVVVRRGEGEAGDRIVISYPPTRGQHVRARGEDFSAGDLLLEEGDMLTPSSIMALAAFGIHSVAVRQKPAVTILATGNELRDAGTGKLNDAAIYNSNSPYLMSMAETAGLHPTYAGIIPDTKEAFLKELGNLNVKVGDRLGIVISTGAVSKGDFDFVPDALADMGGEIVFHRVAIRPGKPILFAQLSPQVYFFGLPGNPVAAAVGFRFFVMPLLRALYGLVPEVPLRARLAAPIKIKQGLCCFLKASLTVTADGMALTTVLPGQESFKIKPLLHANGWVMTEKTLEAGECVDFYPAAPQGWL